MTIFAGGMTPSQFYAGLNNNVPVVFNVKAYGAVANNSTDDTAAKGIIIDGTTAS